MINAYITQEHFDRAFPIEKTGRIMVEAAALDSLKAMAQRLQEERDEALKLLCSATRTIHENRRRIGFEFGSPMHKELKQAEKFIAKCTATPEVLE